MVVLTTDRFKAVFLITKTCLYNIDLLKGEAVLTSILNLCFEQKYDKYLRFLSENFQFWKVKFSIYFNRRVFVMWCRLFFVWSSGYCYMYEIVLVFCSFLCLIVVFSDPV